MFDLKKSDSVKIDSSGNLNVTNLKLSPSSVEGLHRSPNAVTAMFVYDTSKDSDGGAWTEKCQNASWYNETLCSGKWLGAQPSHPSVPSGTANGGDFYQLTSDGKFYKIYNNILTYSSAFENAIWTKTNSLTVVQNSTTAPDGTLTAYTLVESSSTRPVLTSGITTVAKPVTISIRVKKKDRRYFAIYRQGDTGWAIFDLDAGTLAVQSGSYTNASGTITSLGSGWYLCTTTFTGGVSFSFQSQIGPNVEDRNFTGDGASGVYVWGAQAEYSNFATTYEAKTSDGAYGEVFRGNKASFPKLAAIVVEALNVNIYDLTEPGRPMWMRTYVSGMAFNAISMTNSQLIFTSNGYGILEQLFARDIFRGIYRSNGSTANVWGQISNRHGTATTYTVSSNYIVNNAAWALDTAVSPDSPIDPLTGLKIPTIAVATSGGISIIKPDGTVVSSASTSSFTSITLSPTFLSAGRADTTWYYVSNPNSLAASFALTSEVTGSGPDFNIGSTSKLIAANNRSFVRTPGTALVQLLRNSASTVTSAISSNISNTYNTGWQIGDIRRTYLSDISAGSTSGTDLAVNGSFDTDLSGWTINQATSWVAGAMRLQSDGNADPNSYTTTSFSVTPGSVYAITMVISNPDITSRTTYIRLSTNGAPSGAIDPFVGSSGQTLNAGQSATITIRTLIPSGVTSVKISASLSVGSGQAGAKLDILSISVKEIIADRSYKAAIASITGTLTKSLVATNSQLVAYSGFSAANYIQESYSADLDFGTGEWSIGGWVNYSSGDPRANLAWPSELLVVTTGAGQTWSNDGMGTVLSFAYGAGYGGADATRVTRPSGNSAAYLRLLTPVSGRGFLNATTSFDLKADGDFTAKIQYTNVGTFAATLPADGTGVLSDTSKGSLSYLGDGWYRFSKYHTVDPGDIRIGGNATGDGTIGILISRAQMSYSSSPGSYTKTSTGPYAPRPGARIASRSYSVGPSIDLSVDSYGYLTATAYDGVTTRTVTTAGAYSTATWLKAEATYNTSGKLAILVNGVEVASTTGTALLSLSSRYNQLTYSNTFSNAIWEKNRISITATAETTDPLGTSTAWKILETAVTNTFPCINYSVFLGGAQTLSVYAKAAERSWLIINPYEDGDRYTFFNLASGVVGTNASGNTASITSIGNGWYRCSVSRVVSTSASNANFRLQPASADGVASYAGDIAKGIYIWGAQLETGSTLKPYQRVGISTDFDFQAPLTIGNSYALDAPFPGSIALVKLGATVPTSEQALWAYNQEKQMFRAGAYVTLPDANNILDLAYDESSDKWIAISSATESSWANLVRTSTLTVPAGSFIKTAATSGIKLEARSTVSPGVDISIPVYNAREEVKKTALEAARLDANSGIAMSNQSILIGNISKLPGDTTANEVVIGYNATGNGANTITLGNSSHTALVIPAIKSAVIDGASAVGTIIDTLNAYGTTGAKLLSVRNNGTEKAYIDANGEGFFNGIRVGKGLASIVTNTTVGANTFTAVTTGYQNTAIGSNALKLLTTGAVNTAVGADTLSAITTQNFNTAVGQGAGAALTSGASTMVGYGALAAATTIGNNTAIGYQAIGTGAGGGGGSGFNVAIGHSAGKALASDYNVVVGASAGANLTSGGVNVAIGFSAFSSATTSSNTVAIGSGSIDNLTTGNYNTAVGVYSGRYIANGTTYVTSQSNSTFLGYKTMAKQASGDNEIVIGYQAIGNGSNSVVLGNDSITTTVLKGNVGIGTTSPRGALDVATASGYCTSFFGATAPVVIGGAYPTIAFNAYNAGAGWKRVTGSNYTGLLSMEPSTGNLYVATGDTGSADATTGFTTRLYLSNSGNVGIGTTSPGAKLEVAGGSLRIQGLGSDPYYYTDIYSSYGAGGLSFNIHYNMGNVTTHVFSSVDGKIGFNTTTPSAGLHAKSLIATGASAIAALIDTSTAWSTGAKLLSLQNNGTEKAYVDANGYIISPLYSGPGTDSGGYTVGLAINASTQNFLFQRSGNWLNLNVTGTTPIVTTSSGSVTLPAFITNSASTIQSSAAATDTAFVRILDLVRPNTGARFQQTARFFLGGYDALQSAHSQLNIGLSNATTDGSTDVTVMSLVGSGNVGIGTTSPSATLHVRSLTADGASSAATIIDTSTAWSSGKLLSVKNNGTEKAYIDANGHYVGGFAYGSMYENNDPTGTSITLTTQSTSYQWVTPTAGVLDAYSNVTYNSTNKQLVIGTNAAGDYEVSAHTTVSIDTNNQVIEFAVFVNGSKSVVRLSTGIATSNTEQIIGVTGILNLPASATVDIRFANDTSAGKVMKIYHSQVSIKRIS